MQLPQSLTVPHWRTILRHAIPNVVIGKLLPAVVFVALLRVSELQVAVIGALVWSVATMVFRMVLGKPIPGLLWLTSLALIARTVAALATGSAVVYFLQPTVTTWLVGAAFFISVPLGRPLAERIAIDLLPLEPHVRAHPVMRRFFRDVSIWWGFTSMVNFGVTLWLLLSHSPTTFVLVKSFLGPLTTTITFGAAFFWMRGLMRRAGTTLVFAAR